MARSLWARLNAQYGSPLSGAELLALSEPKLDQLRAEQLVPESLDSGALAECAEALRGRTVAVVGAGFAGLAAAWYLRECGVGTVVVFESSDRIGGRVRTDR